MRDPNRPLVVVCGDTLWHGHRLGAQHIGQRLTRYADVLFVEQPRSPIGRLRHGRSGSSRFPVPVPVEGTPGLFVLSPIVNPGKTRKGGRALAGQLARQQLRAAARRLRGEVHATIQIPVHFPFLGACGEQRRVHLASDDFVAAARQNRVDEAWVKGAEQWVAGAATQVIAVSEVLAERWRGYGFEPDIIPNGCDARLYANVDSAAPVPGIDLPYPVLGFIGTLSERMDTPLLTKLAKRGHSLLLVGPRAFTAPTPDLNALFRLPNVKWTGSVPYTEVPRYVRYMDVGLVPYRVDDFNRASFPLKALDYLAAGRPAVSTDIPALKAIGGDLAVTTGHESFIAAVDDHLGVGNGEEAQRQRRAVAAEHSWDTRVREIAEAIGLPDEVDR